MIAVGIVLIILGGISLFYGNQLMNKGLLNRIMILKFQSLSKKCYRRNCGTEVEADSSNCQKCVSKQ